MAKRRRATSGALMWIIRLALAYALVASLPRVCQSYAAEKTREWQTGKVLDSERSRYFAGTVGGGNTNGTVQANGQYQGTLSSSQTAVYRVYETFLIEGESHAYLAQERLKWRWSKPANLTVNGPVQFAVDKRKLFVIDEDGKQHEMSIMKRILRQR